MATEPMTDARLAEIRRGLECGCYDQKWVGELMAEIDRLRTVAKCGRLRLEPTDAVRGLSHAQLGVIRAVILVRHPNETPQLASAREQAIGWLTAVIEALHD